MSRFVALLLCLLLVSGCKTCGNGNGYCGKTHDDESDPSSGAVSAKPDYLCGAESDELQVNVVKRSELELLLAVIRNDVSTSLTVTRESASDPFVGSDDSTVVVLDESATPATLSGDITVGDESFEDLLLECHPSEQEQ